MARASAYAIIYAEEVRTHMNMKRIPAAHHPAIRGAIEEQLRLQPDVATRNRKPLRRSLPFLADWEARCGPDNRFRVFYGIDRERREVHVLAIGVKEGSRLFVGGEEVLS